MAKPLKEPLGAREPWNGQPCSNRVHLPLQRRLAEALAPAILTPVSHLSFVVYIKAFWATSFSRVQEWLLLIVKRFEITVLKNRNFKSWLSRIEFHFCY